AGAGPQRRRPAEASRREVMRLVVGRKSSATIRFRRRGTWMRSRAFTLIEVIIAAGILFSCLFAILALLSGALRNARALQQKKTELMGMAASEIYAMLVNTNQVSEGTGKGDFGDAYPEYRYEWARQEVGTNGLCQVDIAL